MGKEPRTAPVRARGRLGVFLRRTDTYGLVLILILLDYIAVSALNDSSWGRVCIVVLLGLTLWYTLRVSRARKVWQVVAILYLLASTISAIVSEVTPGENVITQRLAIAAGVLLIITPIAIGRRISAHRVITVETVMGAVSVYLLVGMSFAFMYSAIAHLSGAPFFSGRSAATINAYLFFSYSTLTTVGYGNLVPEGNVGQTFAMLEALFGQIYLVIVVARLVSLWGQERPRTLPRMARTIESEEESADEPLPGGAS
jgi:Ion channel